MQIRAKFESVAALFLYVKYEIDFIVKSKLSAETWSGMLGGITRDEYQTIASPATSHSAKRLQYFDLTAPVLLQETIFITSDTKGENIVRALLSVETVFQPIVLVLILTCMVILLAIATTNRGFGFTVLRFCKKLLPAFSKPDETFEFPYAVASRNIAILIFSYTTLLFTGLFRGSLLTSMLLPVKDRLMTEFELLDSAENGKIQFIEYRIGWER